MVSVSYSKAKTFQTCEKQWVFTYGMGLSPVDGELSEAVSIGQYGHKYLEIFYKKLKETEDYDLARDAMAVEAGKEINTYSTKAFVAAMKYVDSRPRDGFPLFVEEKFRMEIDEIDVLDDRRKLTFTFVPDLVWEYTEGPWKGLIS
ncbi:MAG: PD-(D/E)XK nuclease family protein, partial [Thermodesulfobacteriota bacterium]